MPSGTGAEPQYGAYFLANASSPTGVPGIADVTANISFGRIIVNNLPAGVTVQEISFTYDIEQKTTARSTVGSGYPRPQETWVSKRTGARTWSTAAWAAGQSYTFFDSKNGGWTGNLVTYLGSNRSITWDDGVARTSWAIKNTWKAGTAGDPRVLTTSDSSSSCTNAVLMELGQLDLSATFGISSTQVRTYGSVEVLLSDGQRLTFAKQSVYV